MPSDSTPPSAKLESHLVPQAIRLEKVVLVARLAVQAGQADAVRWPNGIRDLGYYRSAARALGLLDDEGFPTARGRALAKATPQQTRAVLRAALEGSVLGRAWARWAGATTVAAVDPASAQQFLTEVSRSFERPFSPSTIEERALRLGKWWVRLYRKQDPIGAAEQAPATRTRTRQLSLDEARPSARVTRGYDAWPSMERFPHNEGDRKVGTGLDDDLRASAAGLLVAGYASIGELIEWFGRKAVPPGLQLRVLFGFEPGISWEQHRTFGRKALPDEIREHWLREQISILDSGAVAAVIERVRSGSLDVRLSPEQRPVHAKLYVFDGAATVGSSNFTSRGLRSQSEGNARFPRSEAPRYAEAQALAEGFWASGRDYREAFVELLSTLLRRVGWKEALARACAALLEGDWAGRYVSPDELEGQAEKLWPHQAQGIGQALWVLENVGSVLIADAAGSGKSKLGAWLLRAAYDRGWRLGVARGRPPVVIAPTQVLEVWEEELAAASVPGRRFTHGALSQHEDHLDPRLLDAIAGAEILAIDEAHNFVRRGTKRTMRLVGHYADHAILFTATPINRGAPDLLALVELLGADHFPDESIQRLQLLAKVRHGRALDPLALQSFRDEIRRFTVRRTRGDLNRLVAENEPAYRVGRGRISRYPRHVAAYYDCAAPEADLERARRIEALASELRGVKQVGKRLVLPPGEELEERIYLSRLVGGARALARYHVMRALRSSRAALVEHCLGTKEALRTFGGEGITRKQGSGDLARAVRKLGGSPPEWALSDEARALAADWLTDPSAHAAACEAEAILYEQIAALAREMSSAREDAKLSHLRGLAAQRRTALAFDGHDLTLQLLHRELGRAGVERLLLTGGTSAGKRASARRRLGREGSRKPCIALCSDAFSEGLNLQGAGCVVHLDTPTVIRTAEQRAGRVDRMNSRHEQVEVHWPRDPPEFAPRGRELLRERLDLARQLIGTNVELPVNPDAPVDASTLAALTEAPGQATPFELSDAFEPVRGLIGSGGLLDEAIYEEHRRTRAELRAAVASVATSSPWAFFAVATPGQSAPRWVLLDSLTAEPCADLGVVASKLRERLGGWEDVGFEEEAGRLLRQFVTRLGQIEEQLLPPRRGRAIRQARFVIDAWARAGLLGRGPDADVLRRILDVLERRRREGEIPDLGAIADVWLKAIGPRIREHLANRAARKELWRLELLTPALVVKPLDLRKLAAGFAALPTSPPIERRVVAAIVGIPPGATWR